MLKDKKFYNDRKTDLSMVELYTYFRDDLQTLCALSF